MLTADDFFIAQLTKHVGGPKVFWSFDFEGKSVVVTSNQLVEQRQFRSTVFRQVLRLPPRRDKRNFELWVENLVQNSIETKAPPPGERGGGSRFTK